MAPLFSSSSQESSFTEQYNETASSSEQYNGAASFTVPFQRVYPYTLFLLSGLALIIGDIVNTGLGILTPFFPFSPALFYLLYIVGAFSFFFAYLGLPGLHLKQGRQGGGISLIAILSLCCSAALYLIYVFGFMSGNPFPHAFYNTFNVLNNVGLFLLGIAIIRASIFPRWTGVLLMASGMIFAASLAYPPSDPLSYYGMVSLASVLNGIAFFRCAYLLLQRKVTLK